MGAPEVRRVAVIGLDSAEWLLLDELLASGDLPNLAALRRRSAVAMLDNPDYRTGLVWEHFLNGRSAAGCGRVAAVEFDPATYDVWQQGAGTATPFYAVDPAPRSIVFDVPYVSLSTEVPGVQVTGWGGHDPGYPPAARPAGLLREIEARFGHHPASENDYEIVWNRPAAIDALADALVVGTRRRADIARWLLAREPDWELFATVLSEPHSVNEALWHGVDDDPPVAPAGTVELAGRRLREVYRAVDDAVGRILVDLPDDAAVVVFSMHGSGRNDADVASMVLLPELLHRLHAGSPFLLQPDTDAWAAAGHPIVVPDPDTSWPVHMQGAVPGPPPPPEPERRPAPPPTWRDRVPEPLKIAYRAARAAQRAALRTVRSARQGPAPAPSPPPAPTPDAAGATAPPVRLGALGRPIDEETARSPEEIGVPRSSVDWQITARYRASWPSMRAFALPTFYDGRVRINLQGRERDGVVPLEDYEKACREVEEAVAACRDPRTGEPILAEVRRLRAGDPLDPAGPDADLQLIWTHATDSWEHPTAGTIGPFPYRRTGGHSPRGFAFVSGPGIEPGDLGARSAFDVTPTILALLGRDPGDGLEGRSLLDIPVRA